MVISISSLNLRRNRAHFPESGSTTEVAGRHPNVVRKEDDDRVVGEAERFEPVEQPAEALVHVAARWVTPKQGDLAFC